MNTKKQKKRAKRPLKSLALLIALLAVIGAAVGGTTAFLADKTEKINNTFTPSKVTTTVEETFDNNVKSDVKIKNTGDTTAWIRAAVVVTWQDKDDNVYGQLPVEGTDYTISYDLNNGWLKGDDGFYYWSAPVANTGKTGVLITSCQYTANAPEGYTLSVEILSSGIQYQPKEAFAAWAENSGIAIATDGKTLEQAKKAGEGE